MIRMRSLNPEVPMRGKVLILLVAASCVLAVPSAARAQAYFAPYVGFNFGGDASDCPSAIGLGCSRDLTAFGFYAGALKSGIVGGEFDFSYSPRFFDDSPATGGNNVLTFMGNLLLSVPVGPVRVYGTGGAGIIRSNVERVLDLRDFSENSFAYSFGGGLMLILPAHLGLRLDVRHMATVNDVDLPLLTGGTKLNFSRASVALVIH